MWGMANREEDIMYYIIVADTIVNIHSDLDNAVVLYEKAKTFVTKGKRVVLAKSIFNGLGLKEEVKDVRRAEEDSKRVATVTPEQQEQKLHNSAGQNTKTVSSGSGSKRSNSGKSSDRRVSKGPIKSSHSNKKSLSK